jgi:hypothetical protein
VSALRTLSVWVVAALLTLTAVAFFAAIAAAQLTSEDTGHRLHRRSVAVTTSIDSSIPGIEAGLQAAAADGDSATVRVPGFPIAIDLPREEAATLSGADLRDRILHESAKALYNDGMSAWASNDDAAQQDIERLSAAGLIDRGLGLVTEDAHTALVIITILLGVMTAAMTAILLVVLPRDARLVVVGVVIMAAALPSLAAAVGLRFAFRTADADADEFVNGLMDIGADSMWVPIRNYLTLTVLGAALLLLGSVFIWWEARTIGREGRLADSAR